MQQLGGEIVVTGQFGQVDADDVLLRQAFSNLFRNAIEACQPTGVAPHVRVEGTLDAAQNQARVSVHDNGPGVDPNARDRIFRPFFTTKKTGTGLGLALVQKIIVTHNGRVTAGQLTVGRRVLSGDVAARVASHRRATLLLAQSFNAPHFAGIAICRSRATCPRPTRFTPSHCHRWQLFRRSAGGRLLATRLRFWSA